MGIGLYFYEDVPEDRRLVMDVLDWSNDDLMEGARRLSGPVAEQN